MESLQVPTALADRLGRDATLGLLEFTATSSERWSEHVLSLAEERYERRLTQEVSALRVELIREFYNGLAGIRRELSHVRVELFKRSFLFWVGQVAATAGLLAFMLRR